MRRSYLPRLVLQNVTERPLQDAGAAPARRVEPRRVLAELRARAPGFDADHSDAFVAEERVKQTNRIRAAADARDERVRQATFRVENLRARLSPDDALERANHERVRVRAERAAEQVVRVRDVRHPVAQGLVDRVLERARAGVNLAHLRAEQTHSEDVETLASHVLRAHVNDALQAEQRAHGRGRDAVLSRAGLGDDARLAHAAREENLAERVVYFVRTRVREVFALEVDARAARVLGQTRGEEERRRAARIITQQRGELVLKTLVVARHVERLGQLFERRDESFWHVATTVRPPVAARVRVVQIRFNHRSRLARRKIKLLASQV